MLETNGERESGKSMLCHDDDDDDDGLAKTAHCRANFVSIRPFECSNFENIAIFSLISQLKNL